MPTSKSTTSDALSIDVQTSPLVQLEFNNVSIEVKTNDKAHPTKRILDAVSGIFGPSECIALMGPSGSGKTTMLNALTGVSKPTSGSITVNGEPFDKRKMRRYATLVPQDDLLTPSLTVKEALMEASLFKQGSSLTTIAHSERVGKILSQFALSECQDVLIGHPEGKKGISGGQKRRLSVALELCGDPSLLYLDEPTSGLDAVSTMTLVRLLQSLGKGGKTVIATIHQPSAAAFYSFDRLLLLHRGQLCYQGPIQLGAQPVDFFSAAGFPCPTLENPADFIFQVLSDDANVIRQKYLTEGIPEDASRQVDKSLAPLAADEAGRYRSSFLTQLRTHARRNAISIVRDPLLARLRVASSIVVGIVLGVLYFDLGDDNTGVNDTVALMLFSMLFMAIINALPVVISVLPELAVVQKEVRNNWYSPNAYVPAKLLVETPLLVLPALLYCTIMGNMSTLTWDTADTLGGASRFFMVFLALVAVVFVTHAWALFLCAIAPSIDVAILLAPGSIMPMALLSGFFKNQQDMSWVFRWFTYVDYLNYAWQAMAFATFRGRTYQYDVQTPSGPVTATLAGEDVLRSRLRLPDYTGDVLSNYWLNIGILLAFMLFFRVLATLMIARRLSK